jgi:hypothetical protein
MIAVVSFLLGVVAGAIGLARFWTWRISQPDVAKTFIKGLYRKSHPHWLQASETDKTRVCPCCGWNETEGLVSEQKCTHGNPAAARDPSEVSS